MLSINLRVSLVALGLFICLVSLCSFALANKLATRGAEVAGSKISCENVRCGYGASCAIKNGRPTCKCPSLICAEIYEPVCGTDGITYSNSCALKTATCKSNGSITKAKDGECAKSSSDESGTPPTETHSSDDDSNEHDHNESNPKNNNNYTDDEKEHEQESDKKTKVKKNNKKGRKPPKDNDGDLDDDDDSSSTKCNSGKSSNQPDEEQTKSPRVQQQSCSVKPCTKILRPVCGSNGISYNNICILQNTACKTHRTIYKIKDGPCDINSDIGSLTLSGEGSRTAECRLICQLARAPACSKAQLRQGQMDSCLTPAPIRFVKRCQCNFPSTLAPKTDCYNIACHADYTPVCGSNNWTYGNDCALSVAACASQTPIHRVHDGECGSEVPHSRDPFVMTRISGK